MPVPNDLSPEEEREFTAMGVPPAGPGMEPTGEPNQSAAPPAPAENQPRNESGQFAPKPAAAAPAQPVAQPQAAPVAPGTEAPPAQLSGDGAPPPAPPPGFVPHAALHEARAREQTLRQQMITLQARTNALLASSKQPQQVELPDLNADPQGYVRAIGEGYQELQEQRQREAYETQIMGALEQDEETFRSMVPDYDVATDHYIQSRQAELSQFYPPYQVQQVMKSEVLQIAQQAWQVGKPAAQVIYELAKARGYQRQAAQQQFQPQQFAPAPQQPQGVAPAAQIAAIQAGQAQTRTLGTSGGAPGVAELNAQALLAMSDEEFEAHLKLGQKGANARFAAIGG